MSFSIGLSGLRAVSEELNVISHNIANVNTAGFKAGRAEFAALYSGGQAGGVEMNNVSQNFDRNGDVVSSGRALDLAISGSGFFVLSDSKGQVAYSRAGMFQKDADNRIVASNGMALQGYGVNADGQLVPGVIGDLKVTAANVPAKASTKVDFVANLKADASKVDTTAAGYTFDPNDASSYNFSQSGKLFDSLGVEHTLTHYFVKTGDNTWRTHYYVDGKPVQSGGADQVQDLVFNADGSLQSPTGNVTLNLSPAGANPMAVELNVSGLSQYASDFNVSRNQSDGYTAGDMTGVRIEQDGSLMAVFSNGQSLLQGQIVMANFANASGLQQGDNTTWTQTFSSGQPTLGVPGTGTLGSLTSGSYEGSNVDLTGELVNLMTAQRNYQANAKSISAADKMTQVLFNSF
ncbi:flagellar hook protein FlgE [Pseudaeromonas sharmana]|uniref:Flagellar hook protein FlgE n=1 Tax=Pseudaeromonas sharmana TaxID=328412 RepID=A0ABV8CNF8_9GAMM